MESGKFALLDMNLQTGFALHFFESGKTSIIGIFSSAD